MKIIFTAKTFIEGNFILKEPVQVLYCFYKINMYIDNGLYILSVTKETDIEDSDLIELSKNEENHFLLRILTNILTVELLIYSVT